MKKFSVLIFLHCFVSLHGQEINDLDKRNGIKQFELGTARGKYELRESFIGNSKRIKSYEYVGDEPVTIFGYDATKTKLVFLDDSLYIIMIDLKAEGVADFIDVKGYLKRLFGDPTKTKGIESFAEWSTENTILKLTCYNYCQLVMKSVEGKRKEEEIIKRIREEKANDF